MGIYVGVLAALFAFCTIVEKHKERNRMFAVCFCVSMAVLAILNIM